jgi:hypothetical protein
MELTENTLAILKNFASINSNIVIEEGNVIRTVSESKTILSRAELDMTIPKTFGIYELNEFLSVLGLVDSPRLDFSDDYATISDSSGRTKIKYFYSEPDILTKPTKDIVMPSTEVTFALDRSTMSQIRRAAAALGHTHFSVTNDDGVINLSVVDNDDDTSHAFTIAVDGESSLPDFKAVISINDLKMIDGDYRVSLSSKLISHFVNTESNVEYWVALSAKQSTF